MPKGVYQRPPRTYPEDLVEQVRTLYVDEDLTQRAISTILSCSQTKVREVMTYAGIPARPAHGHLTGEQHPHWRGDEATYEALHARVRRHRGRPQRCDRCSRTDPDVTYDWANLTGRYEDVNDYERMCRPCHRTYDNAREGATA